MQKHVLTGGFTFRYNNADTAQTPLSNWKDPDSKSGSPTYQAGGVSMTYAAYLQAEIALLDSLTLYAGVRDDYWVSTDGYAGQTTAPAFSSSYDGTSKNSVSPKGAVVWKPLDGTTLRISGGKAFNPPTIYQQFRTWASQTASTVTNNQGNPNLVPETDLAWDIGVEQKLWKGAKFKATYFENYMENLIYNVTTSVSPVVSGVVTTNKQQSNVGGAESKGFELEAEQAFGKFLRLFAGYTYTDASITNFTVFVPGQTNLTGKFLSQVPRHMLNTGIDASYGPASLFLTGRYVAKRYGQDDNSDVINNVYTSYDPYFLMDLKAAYKITNWATLSLAVDNLLDRQYFNYYRAPGRSWFANLDMKF
jgi:iron complex outermembrane receptor protein